MRLALCGVLVAGCAGGPATAPSHTQAGIVATASSSQVPASEPSEFPSPSDPGAPIPSLYPQRETVEVVSPIVERAGIPADMRSRYWSTSNDAGEVGTTAQLGVPGIESVLWAADGSVVSIRQDGPDAHGYGSSRVIVRDLRTGRLVREIETALVEVTATIASGHVFWTGMARVPMADPDARAIDGGVWAEALDGTDQPQAIVAGGRDVTALELVGRGMFVVSDTGRTISSFVGGLKGRFSDVIDATTLQPITRLDGMVVNAVTDRVALAVVGPVTDAPNGGDQYVATDLETGHVLWRYPAASEVENLVAFNTTDVGGTFLAQYAWGTAGERDLVIATFDPMSGARRVLRTSPSAGPWDYVIDPISGPAHIALSSDAAIDTVVADDLPVSILDVVTGSITQDAFTIDTPWLCFGDFCHRDGP